MRARMFFCIVAVVLVGVVAMVAFGQSQFVKTLGGTDYDLGWSVIEVSDGGFVVIGETHSYSARSFNFLLAKLDGSGNHLWTKILGGGNWDGGYSVVEGSDGGLVVIGYTYSYGAGDDDLLLAKFDADGNLLWTKTLGGTAGERGYSMAEVSDGGFVVTGVTISYGAGSADLLLAKFDGLGNHLWTKTLGGIDYDRGWSVAEVSGGGLVVTGETSSYGAGSYDLLLAKFDASGNHLWTKTLGGTGFDYGHSVIEVSDGGLVVTGGTYSYGAGDDDLLLAKFDADGNLLWTKTLGGTDYDLGWSVVEVSDGGLVITGITYSYGAGSADLLLAKLDGSGNHLWTKILGGGNWDGGYSVVEGSDGGLVVIGYTYSYGAGDDDLLLAKFDADGNTCMGEFVTPTVQSISPTITTASPATTTPSPTITSPSPTITSPTPTMTVVCEELITGTIAGMVEDASTQDPIVGALVEAMQGASIIGSDNTESNGSYSIPNLPVGTYDVRASKDGYETKTENGVEVIADQTTTVDFQLNPSPSDTLFFDDFADGNDDGWQKYGGCTWAVENEEYTSSVSGSEVWCLSMAGNSDWTDYILEADVYGEEGVDKVVAFRVIDENNFYALNVRSDWMGADEVTLSRIVDGVSTEITTAEYPSQLNTWYHVQVKVIGDNIKIRVDDNQVIDYTDTGTPLDHGRIAVTAYSGAYGSATVRFDNVLVAWPPGVEGIQVLSPNGGEEWVVGSEHDITWISFNFTGDVKIEYSTNGGTDWTPIISSTEDDGTHPWTVPDNPSTNCLVKVSDAADSDPYDVSNAPFTISSQPSISVTSPNGGENWIVGSQHDITWTSVNFTGNVKIEYSANGGTDWTPIVTSTEDDGIHPWTIPDDPSTNCLVRVSDAVDGDPWDVSGGNFIIFGIEVTILPFNYLYGADVNTDELRLYFKIHNPSNREVTDIRVTGAGDIEGIDIADGHGGWEDTITIDLLEPDQETSPIRGRMAVPHIWENKDVVIKVVQVEGWAIDFEDSKQISLYYCKGGTDNHPFTVYHRDGYSFDNPRFNFRDWKEWVSTVFTSPYGLLMGWNLVSQIGGKCWGMASSSSMYFIDPSTKPTDNQDKETYEMDESNFWVKDAITRYHMSEILVPQFWDYLWFGLDTDPEEEEAKAVNLLKSNKPFLMGLVKEDLKNHAISGYKIIRDYSSNISYAYSYDNNFRDLISQAVFYTASHAFNYEAPNNPPEYEYPQVWVSEPKRAWSTTEIYDGILNFIAWHSKNLFNRGKALFSHACPIRMLLTDEYYRRVGFIDGITFVNEIPDAKVYSLETGEGDSVTYFEVPDSLNYTVEFFGSDSGQMISEVLKPLSQETSLTLAFIDIPVTPNMWAITHVDTFQNYDLEVDYDGDGEIDTTIAPTIANSPPAGFDLLCPVNHDTVDTLTPTLTWASSFDLNGDEIHYRVYLDSDSSFLTPDSSEELLDTSWTVTTPLSDSATYYWKVAAFDSLNPRTWCIEPYWDFVIPYGVGVKQGSPTQCPHSFALLPNYPNPFNPITEIKYALPRDCWVKLEVYNILGQKVASLVDGKQKAGYKTARWDAGSFSSGIYFYRLRAGDFVQTRKMVLLR